MQSCCNSLSKPKSAWLASRRRNLLSLENLSKHQTIRFDACKIRAIANDIKHSKSQSALDLSIHKCKNFSAIALRVEGRWCFQLAFLKGVRGGFRKLRTAAELESVLDRWSVSGMGSSNKVEEEHGENGIDERESKRAKLDTVLAPQEQIVKSSGFANRALRSVLKGIRVARYLARHNNKRYFTLCIARGIPFRCCRLIFQLSASVQFLLSKRFRIMPSLGK